MTRLLVVSPSRNEASFAVATLESVVRQTLRPTEWILVDDGSSDGTAEIFADFAARYDFIRVVTREDRGKRAVGPGVIEAFEEGYRQAESHDVDLVCKLDMDLDLPPRYFELLVQKMRSDPRLGTVSGKPWFVAPDGSKVEEKIGDDMSAGMTKLYRKRCFDQIGGFVHEVMWDGIDCHRARMLGWSARSFDDPELRFTHLRPMGSSQGANGSAKGSLWTGRMRHGRGQWFMGTGFCYMSVSAAYRATQRPYLLGGLAMWLGYLGSMLRLRPRYEEPGFRAFLRAYQRSVLVHGRERAMERLHGNRATIWNDANADLPAT